MKKGSWVAYMEWVIFLVGGMCRRVRKHEKKASLRSSSLTRLVLLVFLKLNLTFYSYPLNSARLLVGSWLFSLQEIPSLVSFGACLEVILACQVVLKRVWPSMNRSRLLLIQIQRLPPNMHHHKWKEIIDFVCKATSETNGDQLLTKSPLS